MSPGRGSTPRQTDLRTVSRNVTLTLTCKLQIVNPDSILITAVCVYNRTELSSRQIERPASTNLQMSYNCKNLVLGHRWVFHSKKD
jgi:hypothetical protein